MQIIIHFMSARVPLVNYFSGSDTQNLLGSPLPGSILQHKRELKFLEKWKNPRPQRCWQKTMQYPELVCPAGPKLAVQSPWRVPCTQGWAEHCTSAGSAPLSWAFLEPGYLSAWQRAIPSSLQSTPEAPKIAAVCMAELGLCEANPVALVWLGMEPRCYLCTAPLAPEPQRGDSGI